MIRNNIYEKNTIKLKYYEIKNSLPPLILLHAQGVDALNFKGNFKALSKKYHIYSVDCYGHGESLHCAEKYTIKDIGEALIDFINNVVKRKVSLLGHSSGGLIAAYIASKTNLCEQLILEDPPFFSSQGDRRKRTFNYVDLSTICHKFINQTEYSDFVLYYFSNQYAWNFFPEESRLKIQSKLINMASKYRKKYPSKNLWVPFWPKAALSGFQGMNNYDPLFGETFYNDSFHSGILHDDILKNIECKTVFLKAETKTNSDGLLLAALDEEDLKQVLKLIPNVKVVRFDCGHSIHTEKKTEFIECIINL